MYWVNTMDNLQLLSYKNRLLNAGIPYGLMKRNLRELRDHHDDLLQQALARGLSEAGAKAVAAYELGDPDQLVTAMLARPELRSRLHRYPRVMTIVLPLAAHFAICLLTLFVFLYSVIATQTLEVIVTLQNSWLVTAFEILRITLMYLLAPALGCWLVFVGIRDHVPRRFWITGLVLLSLLGSLFQVQRQAADPERGRENSLNVAYHPGFQQSVEEMSVTFALRCSMTLLLCGIFARVYSDKERTALI